MKPPAHEPAQPLDRPEHDDTQHDAAVSAALRNKLDSGHATKGGGAT
jgi:hypothetical protein